jgi:hypothetical protein
MQSRCGMLISNLGYQRPLMQTVSSCPVVQLASPHIQPGPEADKQGWTSEQTGQKTDEVGSDESEAIMILDATRQQTGPLCHAVVMLRQPALGLETPVGNPCGVLSAMGRETRRPELVERRNARVSVSARMR